MNILQICWFNHQLGSISPRKWLSSLWRGCPSQSCRNGFCPMEPWWRWDMLHHNWSKHCWGQPLWSLVFGCCGGWPLSRNNWKQNWRFTPFASQRNTMQMDPTKTNRSDTVVASFTVWRTDWGTVDLDAGNAPEEKNNFLRELQTRTRLFFLGSQPWRSGMFFEGIFKEANCFCF